MIQHESLVKGTPRPGYMPHSDTLPPGKNVTDTKLENTSLSADVFEGLHEAYSQVWAVYCMGCE